MKKILPVALFALIPFTACSKSEPAPAEKPAAAPAKEAPAQPTKRQLQSPKPQQNPQKKAATDVQELTIESVDNQMTYNKRAQGGRAALWGSVGQQPPGHETQHRHRQKRDQYESGSSSDQHHGRPPKTADVIAASDIAGPEKRSP